jgi:hypothetical protein
MARVSQRRATNRGMGQVRPNSDAIVTQPAMLAVSEPPRSGEVAISHVDDADREAPLSRGALDLLRRTVPRILGSSKELAAAPLDHREGFVLSLVDGQTTVQGLIDVAAMPDGELIAVLRRMRRLGLVTLG